MANIKAPTIRDDDVETRDRRPGRLLLALGAASALVCSADGGSSFAAAQAEPNKLIEVRFKIDASPPVVPADHTCEQRNGVDGIPASNTAKNGGAPGDNWFSEAEDRTCIYINADGSIDYTVVETGVVTLVGCGTGFAVLEAEGKVSAPDVNGVRTDSSLFRLRPRLGTEGMKGVSGTGSHHAVVQPDNSADGAATAIVYCPHPK